MSTLTGKHIVLTGASQGLGAVMARALAAEGADLLLAARSADKLAEVAKSLSPCTRVLTQPTDVTLVADRGALVARALGRARADVAIVRGHAARKKTVRVAKSSRDALIRRIEEE